MSHETASPDEPLAHYREYLRLLAQVQINPRWHLQTRIRVTIHQVVGAMEQHLTRPQVRRLAPTPSAWARMRVPR